MATNSPIVDKIKILYIGNNISIITLLAKLSDLVEFERVDHGFNAVKWIESHNACDIIFCDYVIPGVKGTYFFQYLKKRNLCTDASFVLVHDDVRVDITQLAIKFGIDDYLIPPLDPHVIRYRLKYLSSFRKRYPRNKKNRLNQESLIDSNNISEEWRSLPVVQLAIKRVFDIAASFFGLLLLSPLFLIVAAAIRLESKGAVFYASKRVGQKTFDFYKFRSMYSGADAKIKELEHLNQYAKGEGKKGIDFSAKCDCQQKGLPVNEYCSELVVFSDGKSMCEKNFLEQKKSIAGPAYFKIKDDPRITKVGAFIRRTSIDELPQLFNVLKGDMSIVGNRPLPISEAEILTSDEAAKRFLAPAGITGLWQVELRGKKGPMSEEERRKLDNDYYDNFSLWFDAKIILRTIPALFQEENV